MLKKDIRYQRDRIHTSILKKDRQYNSQKKKEKRTNNDLHNMTQKTKDQVT
jgi:hypothetical protein